MRYQEIGRSYRKTKTWLQNLRLTSYFGPSSLYDPAQKHKDFSIRTKLLTMLYHSELERSDGSTRGTR
jgi:hypothetical protein